MTKINKLVYLLLIIYFFDSNSRMIFGELVGDNVCQDEERYMVNVTRHFLRNITIRDYEWCLQVPPRCSTYKVQQINDSRTVEEERVKYIKTCCSGYKLSNKGDSCIAEGCPNCINGICNKTQICDCEPGYQGIDCSEECDTGFFGKDCKQECDCGDQGICNKENGKCFCPQIQTINGLRCEPTCSRDKPDHECKFQCICFPIKEEASLVLETTTDFDFSTQYDDNFDVIDDYNSEELIRNIQLIKTNSYVTKPWVNIKRSSSYPFSYFTTENNKPPKMYGFDILSTKKFITTTEAAKTTTITTTTTTIKEINNIKETMNNNFSNENLIIDSRLFITVLCAVLFSVLVILFAVTFCVLHRLKERKRECELKIKEKSAQNIPSVSVTARSIFHTPLPEPPTFQNPVFSLPLDSNLQPNAIEVVCNMNFPKSTSSTLQEFFYDHPPSTGSYRAASIPEPPTPLLEKLSFDPIYDEIPNQKKQISSSSSPPPSYISDKSTLYMNTR
nr:uncharacterized protein LOC111428453 isoform X2 [Onthophagus taurus]